MILEIIVGLIFLGYFILVSQYDYGIWSLAGVCVAIGTAEYGFGLPIFATISANPLLILVIFAAYILIGYAYAIQVRWVAFLKKQSVKYNNFDEWWDKHSYEYSFSRHSDRILQWTVTWIFDLLWKCINNPVTWLFDTIAKASQRWFEDTTKSVLSKK